MVLSVLRAWADGTRFRLEVSSDADQQRGQRVSPTPGLRMNAPVLEGFTAQSLEPFLSDLVHLEVVHFVFLLACGFDPDFTA
jgi:hypothetical protein